MSKKIEYSEPKDYIPKELRKKYGLGEFAKEEEPKQDENKTRENEKLRKVFKGN